MCIITSKYTACWVANNLLKAFIVEDAYTFSYETSEMYNRIDVHRVHVHGRLRAVCFPLADTL